MKISIYGISVYLGYLVLENSLILLLSCGGGHSAVGHLLLFVCYVIDHVCTSAIMSIELYIAWDYMNHKLNSTGNM